MPRPPSCLLLALLCALPGRGSAQLTVGRSVMAPVRDSADTGGERVWAELQRSPGADSTAMAWNYKIGADFRLWRMRPGLDFTLQLGHEMMATPANALGFDPRGALWTEQLALAGSAGARWQWDAGIFMRCRHDIDTGAMADSATTRGTQRVVILPGLHAGVGRAPWSLGGGTSLQVQGGMDWFGGGTDNRAPANRRTPRWSQAVGAWSAAARVERGGPGRSRLYAHLWQSTVWFREPRNVYRVNHRLEGGLLLPGARRDTELLVAVERQFDDMMRPAPRESRSFLMGMRLASLARRRPPRP